MDSVVETALWLSKHICMFEGFSILTIPRLYLYASIDLFLLSANTALLFDQYSKLDTIKCTLAER